MPTSNVAEGRSPVTVAGQPRIHTGFPVAPGNLASGARDRTGVPGSVGTVPAMQAGDAAGTPRRVLILGGSTEASRLARELAPREGYDVTVSYAGRTRQRTSTPGRIRVGGFGGVHGLVGHLVSHRVDVLLDATHPFAARMPHHAAAACARAGVPRLRVCRPAWQAVAGDHWHEVVDLDAAAALLAELRPRRVFLTTGRQELQPFARLPDMWFLVRAIEPPDSMPLADASVLLARGPFDEEREVALLRDHAIDVVVSKNSGGGAAAAKLVAARALGLPVVMVERPPGPPGPTAASVDEALAWLAQLEDAPAEAPYGDAPGYARGV